MILFKQPLLLKITPNLLFTSLLNNFYHYRDVLLKRPVVGVLLRVKAMNEYDGQNKLVPQIVDAETSGRIANILRGLELPERFLPLEELYDDLELFHLPDIAQSCLGLNSASAIRMLECNQQKLFLRLSISSPLRVVEAGIRQGSKAGAFLPTLLASRTAFEYIPIDQSKRLLEYFISHIWEQYPNISIFPIIGDYLDIIADLQVDSYQKIVVINDNLVADKCKMAALSTYLNTGDYLISSFNQRSLPISPSASNERTIVEAVVRGTNLLLASNFSTDGFTFYPSYNPSNGLFAAYLVSTKKQQAYIPSTDQQIIIKKGEAIKLTSHQRIEEDELNNLALDNGFIPFVNLHNHSSCTVVSVWQKI